MDDFQDALDIYSEYLTYRGYRVLTAPGGAEGLALAREQHPDLILLDISMPVTGVEVLRALRADPAFAGTPIVAFTAHALQGERQQALADGFDHVVSKPCLPNDLETIILDVLKASPR